MTNIELQVLNAVLKNKDIGTAYEAVPEELFTAYSDIWETIKKYHMKYNAVPDIEIVQEKHSDLLDIEVKGHTEYYIENLRDERIRSRIANILVNGNEALGKHGSVAVKNKLMYELSKLDSLTGVASDTNIMDFDAAEQHYANVRERAETLGGLPGIPTGIGFIDSAYTTGLAAGDLVVILGWTGRMKSYFSALLACNAHEMGFIPMMVSLEMNANKVRDRVYTIKGSGLFKNSSLSIGDISVDSFNDFRTKQQGKPEFIVVTNDAAYEFTPSVAESKVDQHKPHILIVDYAQLASDNACSDDMKTRMLNMSKEYKRLAVRKNIVVILISSATQESVAASATDSPPMVEQVAWSRQIAYDADLAMAVHKYTDSQLIEIVGRKNRNGPLFDGFLSWDIDNGIIKEDFNGAS